MDRTFKIGDLIKFPDTAYLATIVNIVTEYNTTNVSLWVIGNYRGPNPTSMSMSMLKRRAVIMSEGPNANR